MNLYFTTEFIFSVGIIAIIFWWWFYLKKNEKYFKNIPAPPTVPFVGNGLDFTSTSVTLKVMSNYVKKYGGLVKVQIGPLKNVLLVADYKMLEFILNSNTLLTKASDYQYFYSWLGTGLLIGSGPKWKRVRKILTPAFHFQILTNFIEIFESRGNVLMQKLSNVDEKNNVDIYPLVTLCTLDVICESIMGTSINAQEDVNSEYVCSVKEMCRILVERAVKPMQIHDLTFFFTKNYRIQQRAIRTLHEKSNSVIEKRFKELEDESKNVATEDSDTKRKKIFLDLLLEARIDGRPLSKEEIREEVDTFMFAGHDTTASAISFTLFCLATNPDVQQTAFEEQQSLFGNDKEPAITYTNLQSMKYLDLVIKETLRLYPSVPIIGRQPDEDLVYENTCLPKGTTFLIFLFGIHRDTKYFENPEVFNPKRFENVDGKFPYSNIPFSAGPRNCIGQKFALLEMKSIISKIIRKFELQPTTPEHRLQLVAETVLKSSNGMRICLKARQ